MSTASELERFRDFLDEQLNNGGADLLPEDIVDLWRMEHPLPAQLAASVADLKEAVAEMEAGAEGRPAKEMSAEIRRSLNLPHDA
jgi:hypothetical protein